MATGSNKLSMTNFLEYSRAGLIFAGIGLLFVTIFQVGLSMIKTMSATPVTDDAIAPDYAFGGVPGIRFPYQPASERPDHYQAKFSNNVYFGEPTIAGLTMEKVYKLQNMSFSLSADQKARQIARNLSFYAQPHIVSERTYLYNYPGPPLQETLQIDLKTLFLKFTTNYLSVSNVFGTLDMYGNRQIPQRADAIRVVREFLQAGGILPDDISDQGSSVTYVTSIGNSLQPVQSALEADFVKVSLARKGLEGLRNGEPTTYNFFGPDGYGSIQAVVGRDAAGQDSVVELTDNYYAMDLEQSGTYLLRPVSQAWDSLLTGDAYVINPRGLKTAVITSVELGYYESHGEQDFLLPIYVFRGESDFVAYVQALYPGMYY